MGRDIMITVYPCGKVVETVSSEVEKMRFLVTLRKPLVARIEAMAQKRRTEIRKSKGAGKFFRNDMIEELLEKGIAAERAERSTAA